MPDETNDPSKPDVPVPPEGQRAHKILADARGGDSLAVNELIGLIYPELKRRARWLMMGERSGHTFGPSGSELVQRVMERILESGGLIFNAANTEEELIRMLTRRMRFILVDYARSARVHGKPSPRSRIPLDDVQRFAHATGVNIDDVLSTHEGLAKLAKEDREAATAIELRAFAALTNEEAAAAMGLSVATFRRAHQLGMVFLKDVMRNSTV